MIAMLSLLVHAISSLNMEARLTKLEGMVEKLAAHLSCCLFCYLGSVASISMLAVTSEDMHAGCLAGAVFYRLVGTFVLRLLYSCVR